MSMWIRNRRAQEEAQRRWDYERRTRALKETSAVGDLAASGSADPLPHGEPERADASLNTHDDDWDDAA